MKKMHNLSQCLFLNSHEVNISAKIQYISLFTEKSVYLGNVACLKQMLL